VRAPWSAQAYLLLGDEAYLRMFAQLYGAAMRHLRPTGSPGWPAGHGWLGEVHMHSGAVMRPWISSLSAFWPGLQALVGAHHPPPSCTPACGCLGCVFVVLHVEASMQCICHLLQTVHLAPDAGPSCTACWEPYP
jgi:hypothetical protein